jgi:hypothetical protein
MSILKLLFTALCVLFPPLIIAGEIHSGVLKKCRPGEGRVVKGIHFPAEAAGKLCGFMESASRDSLYSFEKVLLLELKRIYRRTGTCFYLSDPEIYSSIKCKNRGLLHFAALKMQRDFIDEFVNHYRLNVNMQDSEGYTIYDYADLSTREIAAMLKFEKKHSRRKVLKEELVLWGKFKEYLIDEFNGKPCRAIPAGLRRIKKCPDTGL